MPILIPIFQNFPSSFSSYQSNMFRLFICRINKHMQNQAFLDEYIVFYYMLNTRFVVSVISCYCMIIKVISKIQRRKYINNLIHAMEAWMERYYSINTMKIIIPFCVNLMSAASTNYLLQCPLQGFILFNQGIF